MSSELVSVCPPSSSALAAFELAAWHLQRVSDRLADATSTAHRLAGATDWHTPAARAFFELAERLAADIGALGSVAEAVRAEVALARARLASAHAGCCR